MNKLDEFWFWVFKAITEPVDSNVNYYYDRETDKLFGLIKTGDSFTPYYRNTITNELERVRHAFNFEIEKVKADNLDIVVLSRFSNEDKNEIISSFLSSIPDKAIREWILEVGIDTERLKFKPLTIKPGFFSVLLEYDMKLGNIVALKIKSIYFPLGISEGSEVIW